MMIHYNASHGTSGVYLLTIALCCALVTLWASPAIAGNVAFKYKEDILGCKAAGLHGPVNVNAVHILTTGAAGSVNIGGVHWKFTGNITETDFVAGINNDKVVLDFDVQHTSNPPPHAGEPAPNPNRPAVNLMFEAGLNGITFVNNPSIASAAASVKHKDHTNCLEASCLILVNANNKDIDSYVPVFVAKHFAPDTPGDKKKGYATLTSGALAPNVVGTAVTLFQVSDRRLELGIGVLNLSVASLTSAQIRQGTPASPGPVILSLPTSAFEDLPTLGMASSFDEFIFPSAFMSDLVSGNTFVELVTAGGTLAGILNVSSVPESSSGGTGIPALSEWGMVILVLSLLSCGYLIIRRRSATRDRLLGA